MTDPDTTGFTPEERAAWHWYQTIVNDLSIRPKLTFYEARLLVDAYTAWIEIFDQPRCRYHIAYLRQQIARQEFRR